MWVRKVICSGKPNQQIDEAKPDKTVALDKTFLLNKLNAQD